ncbi:unnamed protein product [Linum tenue]|uniref:Glycosyl hydrolase family 95 N-terminal domain-containing protein n=1 Tax=Linum tenue TaxID=586396 RepID=A0AAV0P8K1_9ROSI|nr:unnamed protein product [Linum tenue]CAI0467269.1 unnamed protein product [Linum tenue]
MENTASDPLKLNFTAPAKYWTDAIPIGNGRLGAMIWGGVSRETLQLNDDTLWTGVPGDYTDPNAPAALSAVRKLVANGQFADASAAALKLSGKGSEVYQALGDIVLEFDASHKNYDPKTYHRELDLDTATATVKYSVGDVGYTRQHFASNPHQAIVTTVSGSKPGSLSFTIYLDSKMNHSSYVEGQNRIVLKGSCRGNPKGIQFTAMLELQIGGKAVISVLDGGKLKVDGADSALLVLVASSSFDGPFTSPVDSNKDPTSDCLNSLTSLKSLGGAQHLNINLQMNYWPALSCNLKECQDPLFDYLSTMSVNYGAKGWVAHQISDLWGKTSPDSGDAVWAMWPMGGAWLCTHLWEHYSYTMDKEFLKNKAYPLLEGCANFLLDWLIKESGGTLGTNPSTSPEHMFIAPDGRKASVSYSTTMDMSIIREVFSAIVSAAEVLRRKDDELIHKVLDALPQLRPTKIAKEGTIMEWALDFQDPEPQHRHLSHLFGLFPGHSITLEDAPDLCIAAENTLKKRGIEGPGWSTVWKAALWAHLHKYKEAYQMVKHLFVLVDPAHESNYEGGLYSNLFTTHPPFQIDANFGFSAAIAEMLVQSTPKDMYFLPALPRDKWPNGCFKGLKARGGVTVNLCWKRGDLHEVGLWSTEGDSELRLHYRGRTVSTNLMSGHVYTFDNSLTCIQTNPLP